ncbi:MAG TPA: CoA transferase [Candidatus Micrarchaeaceae archaeon]|nr:CoA transferase [Candidatus Micrarchaeaceae archaeon]
MSAAAPLDGIRVAAFTHVAAGPYGTLQMAYLGADVIKVESSTRIDYWRYRDRNNDPERSRTFIDHNKNVRSVTLNLKQPEGLALAKRLAALSDVVVDNYSAGVMDRLGLGVADLAQLNPATIIAHMNGLGSEGPRSHYVTFGPSLMSYVGMTYLWNHPQQEVPVGSQASYPDYLAGVYTAYAIVAALHRRSRGAGPQVLDISQALVTAAAIGPSMGRALNGEAVLPVGNQDPDRSPHGSYPCAGGDDAWCVISVAGDQEWKALRLLMGNPDWACDAALQTAAGRIRERDRVDTGVAQWTSGLTPRQVMELCQARGVAAGIVATGEDLASDPQLNNRGFMVELEHPAMGRLRLPGNPVRFARRKLPVRRLGPLLGQDNDQVLREVLGLSAVQIADLTELGAIR